MSTFYQGGSDATRWSPLDEVRANRGWFIALGIGLILLGLLGVAVPFVATLATTLFIGWLLIAGGIASAIHAFQNRRWAGFPWVVVSSILYVIAGILVVANPLVGTLTLTLILAGFFIASGIVKIVRALQHRSMSGWGWLLFDGIITLVLGALIWARWPATAVWAIGLLVGIEMLLGGFSMVMLGSLGRRPAVHAPV
jgi:uncharacterized membrane protein HdeD (DUF308 family)